MQTVGDLLQQLAVMFPHSKATPETIVGYARRLDDLPPSVLEQAVERLIDTSERFPTLRAIREAAAEITLDLPDEEAALAQVEARMAYARQANFEMSEAKRPPLHPLVARAVDHVGGFYAIRTADEPAVVRGQMLRLYRAERAAAIMGAQVRKPRAELTP